MPFAVIAAPEHVLLFKLFVIAVSDSAGDETKAVDAGLDGLLHHVIAARVLASTGDHVDLFREWVKAGALALMQEHGKVCRSGVLNAICVNAANWRWVKVSCVSVRVSSLLICLLLFLAWR